MKQHINLYHDEFKPIFKLYSVGNIGVFSLLSCVVIASLYFGVLSVQSGYQDELSSIEEKIKSAEAEIIQLTQALEAHTIDPILDRKLAAVSTKVNVQSELLNNLQALSTQRTSRFSSVFNAFSQTASDDLWLTYFSVHGSDLVVRGQLADPTALPKWLVKLANTETFKQQEFDKASVKRSEDTLTFNLSKRLSDREDTQDLGVESGSK
ncbi:PilN domain-containing protein [Agaribacter flavus]|uniref:PilN domain-containing protein n=1 Tax=Agaribacter flavus TaxID=1902781 RepID=A0ABV7FRR4_9ALTE